MNIAERLPSLTNQELATLQGNAVRLRLSGSSTQQEAATHLLPLVTAEIASRKAPVLEPKPKRTKK